MELPEHRALLGVDVIGSARNEGRHLEPVRRAVDELVREALAAAGVLRADVVEWEPTGDGALITLPDRRLGAVLDAAHHLDALVEQHNRTRRPDIRLRLAVEVGPVGPHPGLYAPKIALCRLLNAGAFKDLAARCPGMNTALIVSDQAHAAVFGGDYTRHAKRMQFTSLEVREKEHAATAWIRIPGFDTRQPELATVEPTLAEPTTAEPQPDTATTHSQPDPVALESAGGDAPRMITVVHGSVHGVQANVVNGGIVLGHPRTP